MAPSSPWIHSGGGGLPPPGSTTVEVAAASLPLDPRRRWPPLFPTRQRPPFRALQANHRPSTSRAPLQLPILPRRRHLLLLLGGGALSLLGRHGEPPGWSSCTSPTGASRPFNAATHGSSTPQPNAVQLPRSPSSLTLPRTAVQRHCPWFSSASSESH